MFSFGQEQLLGKYQYSIVILVKTQLFYQNRILSKEGMMIDTMYYVTTDWMDLYFFKFLWTDWTIQFLWLLFQLYLNRRYTRYSRKADEKWVGLHVNLILLLFIFFIISYATTLLSLALLSCYHLLKFLMLLYCIYSYFNFFFLKNINSGKLHISCSKSHI